MTRRGGRGRQRRRGRRGRLTAAPANDRSSATTSAIACTAAPATTRSSAARPRIASRATRATTHRHPRRPLSTRSTAAPGTDTLYADPGDSADELRGRARPRRRRHAQRAGLRARQRRDPPGAGEIVGNTVDEDCAGGPQYLRVSASLELQRRRDAGTRRSSSSSTVDEIKAGDTIEVRCTGGKSKGCPFTKKTQTGKAASRTVNARRAAQEALPEAQRGARGPRRRARTRSAACCG